MYLGIDLGTSSAKTVLMDEDQQIVGSHSAPVPISRPEDGWSEQDPSHWITAIEATLQVLATNHPQQLADVRGIGLSGHMHGATLLDKSDNIIRPCMLWNDTRSSAQAQRLDTEHSREIAGNILFPGFTAPKVAWVADNEPDLFDQVAKVLLPKDYVRLWLTGEHVSEMSDAAGTGWLDVGARQWSDDLLKATALQREQMPSLVEGTAVSGVLRAELARRYGMSTNVLVAGGAGDNAASACGMGTVKPGSAFVSLGTSGVLFAANASYQPNAASAVHTFCHALPDTWHQMGVILAATDALNWLSTLTSRTPAKLAQALQDSAAEPTDVIFLPYLGGERTPINDADARGVFVGLKHGTDAKEMTKAVLQGVAFAFRDCQLALEQAGTTLGTATAIGGGVKSDYWLRVLSTTMQMPLDVTSDGDYGASMGAARLGMIAQSNADPVQVCTPPPVSHTVEPGMHTEAFDEQYRRYKSIYAALKNQT